MKTLIMAAVLGSGLLAQTAQQPSVSNSRFEVRPGSPVLSSALQATEATWFGYAIKTMRGDHDNCCFENGQRGGCSLEESGVRISREGRPSRPVQLEGSDTAAVLYRIENNQVGKVRVYSLECPLDAGGRRFVWLTDVPAQSSLEYLQGLARTAPSTQVEDGAVFAIAQHDNERVDDILEALTRAGEPAKVREQAVFWLGASRGAHGVEILKSIVVQDGSDALREKAVFALSIGKQPEGTDVLLDVAKHNRSPHIRGQALFWLAQKAGAKATAALQNAIANDPDTGVKKQAVFALSQLPKDEGVPKLIEISRTQRNPEVRKQAFFWLGQSNDARALAFFEQILLK